MAALKAVYLENYDLELGKMVTSGVDLCLNTPLQQYVSKAYF
jgi:glucan phosphorylase